MKPCVICGEKEALLHGLCINCADGMHRACTAALMVGKPEEAKLMIGFVFEGLTEQAVAFLDTADGADVCIAAYEQYYDDAVIDYD